MNVKPPKPGKLITQPPAAGQPRDWLSQVTQDLGVAPEVVQYTEMEGTVDGDSVRYPCEYPPRIDYEAGGKIVYDRVYRTRTLPDALRENPRLPRFRNPKDENCPGGEMPLLYTPSWERLRQAVNSAGGTLLLYEGDRDPWTAMSAGALNAAGILSAGMKRDERFAPLLKELGVKHVAYYPDADDAGWHVAEWIYHAVRKAGLSISVKRLPNYVRDVRIKDATDVYMALDRNPTDYWKQLESGQSIRFLTPEAQVESKSMFMPNLYALVEQQLGINEYKPNGWSKERACIFSDHEHDDIHPSFGWHSEHHVARCFKCGENWSAKAVAEKLGIDWRPYVAKVEATLELQGDTVNELKIAKSILEGLTGLADYSSVPTSQIAYFLEDALENYAGRLSGAITSEFPPMQNPIKALHRLGGAGRVIQRPMMIGILGVSGGFKTSLLTWVITQLSQQGYNGIVYTPEWSPERNADRIVQQYGGLRMSDMSLLERWYYEQQMIEKGQMPLDDMALFGIKPEDQRLQETWNVLRNIKRKFHGKVAYLREFGGHVLEVLGQIIELSRRMAADGCPVDYVILDYAQLMLPPPAFASWWTQQDTITYTKVVTNKFGFATFMSSQVRKMDTEGVKSGQSILTSTSGLNFHDHQFNLFMTINPTEETFAIDDNGNRARIIKLAVTKNSNGDTAAGIDDAIELYVDLNSLVVVEDPMNYDSVAFRIYEDDEDFTSSR